MYIHILICVILIIIIYLIYEQSPTSELIGGSRENIFSRFNYTPSFPMISQFDKGYSKVYNIAEPIKFIGGRPYKYYRTEKSTWLNPWDFPHEMNTQCTKYASNRCGEQPIIVVKKDAEKLNGLSTKTPKDVVHVSSCFNKFYEQCLKQKTILL